MNNRYMFERALALLIEFHLSKEISALCTERRQRCKITFRTALEGVVLSTKHVVYGAEGIEAIADARIAFRSNARPNAVRFKYKIAFRGIGEEAGFSSIESQGRIDLDDSVSPIKHQGVVYGYNRWEFPSELNF